MLDTKELLEYPCSWTYTVIGADRNKLYGAISAAIPHERYSVSDSNTSRTGKYVSLKVELVVVDEEERNRFHQALGGNADVKYVL